MHRVLRNYLISFLIIGLLVLAIKLVNSLVEQRQSAGPGVAPAVQSDPPAAKR